MPWIKYIFFTVLMSVLLITVYGKTKINIKCSDQNGTVGKSLNLTCSVSNPCGYIRYCFKRNNVTLQNETTPMNSTCTFYYTIANAKVNDSGNYTFWIQMAKGWNDAIFTVTIDIPVKQAGTTSSSKQDSSTAVPFVIVLVSLVCFLITVTLAVHAIDRLRKKRSATCEYRATCDLEMMTTLNSEI